MLITSAPSPAPLATLLGRHAEAVVLIDGARLAELMIEHEVGVTSEPLRIPKVDVDYFEGERGSQRISRGSAE